MCRLRASDWSRACSRSVAMLAHVSLPAECSVHVYSAEASWMCMKQHINETTAAATELLVPLFLVSGEVPAVEMSAVGHNCRCNSIPFLHQYSNVVATCSRNWISMYMLSRRHCTYCCRALLWHCRVVQGCSCRASAIRVRSARIWSWRLSHSTMLPPACAVPRT